MSSLLSVRNLSYSYQGMKDFSGYGISLPSLDLSKGEALCITGESGCGKSTLLECLSLLRSDVKFDDYVFSDVKLSSLSEKNRSALRSAFMGFMPQSGGLISYLNVTDNLKLQIKVSLERRFAFTNIREDEKALTDRAMELLDNFSLLSYAKAYPHELSIGQRQRVVFLKSLCHDPKLIMIDEPTSALDPENGRKLFDLILKITRERNTSVLIVTHDLSLVHEYFDRTLNFESTSAGRGQFVLKELV